MGYKKISLLGVNFTIVKKSDILEEVKKYLKSGTRDQGLGTRKEIEPLVIFTPNPEIVTFAQKNPDFRKIVNSAHINIPDGAGIVWAMKKIHGREIDKITGVDFMQDLVKWAAKNLVVTGLIGGRGGVAVETAECLRKKHPGLKVEVFDAPEIGIRNYELRIRNNSPLSTKADVPPLSLRGGIKGGVTFHNSYFVILDSNRHKVNQEKYFQTLADEINRKKVAILFVALGFPKQELFIENLKCKMQSAKLMYPIVLMAVGGAFDYISGKVPRAPVWMRERGLEWLYRLIREPWRLSRQISGAEFFLRILVQ